MAKQTRRSRRRREKKNVERGAAHIKSTFNNTIVTITDTEGKEFGTEVSPMPQGRPEALPEGRQMLFR